MSTTELHDDGECSHEEGDGNILHNLCAIRHHQDEERRDEEHQRKLEDDERSHLTKLLRRSHTTGGHLVGKRRGRQTDGTEAHSHRVGHQTDYSREHRLKAQSDEDGSGDGHSRSEASHTFKHTAETPCQEEYQQTLVGGHLNELCLNRLNLLRLTKDVVAEDGTNDDQDDREARLQKALDNRPEGDAVDRHVGILLRNDAHRRDGEQGQEDCYHKGDHGTLVTRHFEAHHQDNEQHNRNYRY